MSSYLGSHTLVAGDSKCGKRGTSRVSRSMDVCDAAAVLILEYNINTAAWRSER